MTMSNQMAISAASVAVMANNNTLVNMGAMQSSFFELDGSTINAGLEATSLQASADEKSIIDTAKTQQVSGICEMSGAIAGMAITSGGLISGISDYNQAKQLQNPDPTTQMQVAATQVSPDAPAQAPKPATVAQPTVDNPDLGSAKIVGQNEEIPPTDPTAVIKAQNNVATSDATAQTQETGQQNTADQVKKDTTASDIDKQAEELRNKGKFKMETANNFSGLVSTAIGKSSGIITYDTTIDQAQQSKIKDLEAGLASALNTQTGLIGAQLSGLNDTRSGTYQLMKTLQEVRG